MCGIAGYNCSQAWSDTFLDQDKQNKILEEAWLHNQHRGYDAAGYFAVNSDGKTRVFKNEGSAAELLTDRASKDMNVPVSTVFGAHTRATTQGSEKDNRNNHPVFWDDIWVTHNGSIRNDNTFRTDIDASRRDALPAVDTVAINIALSQVDDPRDINDIVDNLADLQGGFAFHAVWKEHPGLSLIVRGDSSPLIIAVHDGGCMVYGSQPESVWHIIHAMGMDPSDTWVFRTMETGQAMLFQDGLPLAWNSLPKTTTTHWNNTADFSMERILPKEDGREGQVVYSTSRLADFALKDGGHGRSMGLAKKDKHLKVVYTRAEGFKKGALFDAYPSRNDATWQAVTCEADVIYKHKKSSLFHVFYGNIEVVMNQGRVIQDTYNHAVFSDAQRWNKVLPDKEEKISEELVLDFESFLLLRSSEVKNLPSKPQGYAYVENMNLKVGTRATPTLSLMRNGLQNTNGRDTSRKKPHYWKPVTELGWEDVIVETDSVVFHNMAQDLMFLNIANNGGGICSKHNAKFVEHSSPKGCTYLTTAAAFAYANIVELDVLNYVLGGDTSLAYTLPPNSEVCDKANTGHTYQASAWSRVGSHGVEFDILIAEECVECFISKEIAGLPRWLEAMLLDGVFRVINRPKDEQLPSPFESVWD